MHYPTACGQGAVEIVECASIVRWGNRVWKCSNALLQCLGAWGGGIAPMHCHTACRTWAAKIVLTTATLPGGSG